MSLLTSFSLALLLALLTNVANARLISKFGNCPELNNYYINRAVNLVGPYGLNSHNAYTRSRSPQGQPGDPGTPGGPADLPLRRPFAEPQRVAGGNLTEADRDTSFDDSEDNGLVAGVDFSTTNVQVTGVDEPDIIKTDGRRVFTVSGNTFSVVQVLEGGKTGRRVGQLKLPTAPRDMLIQGDFLLALGDVSSYRRPVHLRYKTDPSYGEEATVVYQIHVRGGTPRLVSTLYLEGRYIKSREVDGVVRLVLRFNPLSSIWLYYPTRGVQPSQTKKWNREIIQYSRPGNWLPTYRLQRNGREQFGVYATCNDIYHSQNVFAGFNLLTVVTLPIAGFLEPSSSASIMSDAKTVYATKKSMFVTTSERRFDDVPTNSARWGSNYQTAIHHFALSDAGASYVASGAVTGSVINQFAMHEMHDTFFIATTDGATWWSRRDLSRSKVTAFLPNRDTRQLVKIGEVGNLGVGERIFSVRYIGETAYVVTFRQVDPLYIIDLSNPRAMRVTGELKIPGFSSYLHPVGAGRLLGVGQEATLTGRTTGAKVSLFDVSDKTNPRELSAWKLSGSYSDAQWDHRAFLYWRRERVAVMPVNVYSSSQRFTGAIVLNVSESTITERGRVTHNTTGLNWWDWWSRSIKRNAIIGKEYLWSMSNTLLQVNNLNKLNEVEAQVPIA
ncbi:hypothetical protein BWQ96_08962 [Gracilariopsis chorda]|uniref:Beta propeller domain-containing protein n=1 Tax=Gracilariopsis chorda TaxID=448386 RepID=A0A2V3IGU5_9FLOR|nr:hypothetical protein BWQ96_08962 [Gracilariopsis chorda]|eukprot:PXF41315.1 hypothetical protein BWQ96_08962 [Gracilariopsis chorda]